jgi:CRP-like cAMP-binding protein
MEELTRIQIVVFLQSCDLFSHCRADEILRIAGIARERRFKAGESIYSRGGAADELYCVVHGEVRTSAGEKPQMIGRLQTFGVREILCGRLRDGSAEAVEETLALAIDAEGFFDLLANDIEIVKALFRHLLKQT